jgi:restriction system protein
MIILAMDDETFPSNIELSLYVVKALEALGGSGSNEQIKQEVAKALNLSNEATKKIHSGKRTVLEYKLAWARTIAKQRNLIQPVGRMNWKLSSSAYPMNQ